MDNDVSETVYGTNEDSHEMSERVQSLAASVYKEFERMIQKYDEDVVKDLMPIAVGMLETLDQSFMDKQENEVELELLRDDNEQLLTQYEREKQLRKAAEQKYLEVEDAKEEERKELESKVESLESIVRMFELKAKNAQDHIARLDEKEAEMRKEYNKLHERYTELFKTHMDHMEKTKFLMSGDRMMELGATPKGKSGFSLGNLKNTGLSSSLYSEGATPENMGTSPLDFNITSPDRTPSHDSNMSLRSELNTKQKKDSRNKSIDGRETAEKGSYTDTIDIKERSCGTKNAGSDEVDITKATATEGSKAVAQAPASSMITHVDETDLNTPSVEYTTIADSDDNKNVPRSFVGDGLPPTMGDLMASMDEMAEYGELRMPSITAASGPANESSIFEELDPEDIGTVDDGVDITDSEEEEEKDHLSTGMGKEVENLILENTELLATKNALNVVKDDLIAKVDELTSEQEILREEIASLRAIKERHVTRISELEEELKKMREELEKAKSAKADGEGMEEDDIPMAQRKRFTRMEMARVLMERNQYKERLMELQEAVRWTEMIRASREHPELAQQQGKKKSSIWNFFGNLVGPSPPPANTPKKKGYAATPTVI